MGRYIRQTTKGGWNPNQLKNAIEAVKRGKKIRACANKYKIPESTLRRRMKVNDLNAPILGVSTTFTPEQESTIVEYLKNVSAWYHGLNSIQCRRIAFDTAEKLKIKHKFSKKRRIAGKDWFYGFLKRNPDFSIRKTDADGAQLRHFAKTDLETFFSDLNSIVEEYEFSANRIYNVQETEIFAVKVKEHANDEQSNSEGSWQRSNRTTVTCAMNAVGSFIRPMFIFPFEDNMQLIRINVPENSVVECNSGGCVDEQMHMIWLKHFAETVDPTRSDPVLLILNSHNGHASVGAYEFCKANNIHVLTLPPRAAFQMQPLTSTVFAPLKRAYYKECHDYMTSTDSNEVSVYKIADLFVRALDKTATIDKAIRGFKLTGIWPIDPSVLDGNKFHCTGNINKKDSTNTNSDSSDVSSTSNDSSSFQDIGTSEYTDTSDDYREDSDWCKNTYNTRTARKKKRKCNCSVQPN